MAERKKAPERSEGNTQISFSLSSVEAGLIKQNKGKLKYKSQSEYIRHAAAYPSQTAESLRLHNNPEESDLGTAAIDYEAARARSGKKFEDVEGKREYKLISYPYPDSTEFKKFQNVIQTAASEMQALGIQEEVNITRENEDDFDIIRRTGFFLVNRMLCLFPFLLTETRRPFWGVIPYADHVKIGLYFSNPSHVLLKNWAAIPEGEREQMKGKVYGWFTDLIKNICKKDGASTVGKLFVSEGFLHQEIIQLLLGRYGPTDLQAKFEEVVRSVSKHQVTDKDIPTAMENNDVFVFDLAFKDKLIDKEIPQSQIIEMPHGLTIPVGIGFSLTLLKDLRAEENWKGLLKAASALLKQESYQVQLKKVGINVKKTVVNRTY
jgi:hypothetical protein